MGDAMTEFRRKQLVMAAFSLPAIVVVALVLFQAKSLFGFVTLPEDEPAARLAFAVRWLFLPACTLAVGIQFAARRGFFADAIDGTRFPTRNSLEVNLRYNQNTVEQLVLAAVTWLNLSLVVSHENLALIPAMASLFVFGRLTFWVGYLIRPVARAFGMILTALPTIGSILWLILHWASTT
jgi:hypothetical protein